MADRSEDYVCVPVCPRCGGYHPDKFEPAWDTDDGEEDYPGEAGSRG